MRRIAPTVLLAALVAGGCGQPLPEAKFGAYRLDDGRLVSVRESGEGALRLSVYDGGETRRYEQDGDGRWRADSGLQPDFLRDSVLDVDGERLTLTVPGAEPIHGRRVALPARTVDLDVNGVRLHARLTLPAGAGPHPAVIIAQGSGSEPATRGIGVADFFPVHGVAALVYDKRGTGASTGRFTMDFRRLADDLAALAGWLAGQPDIDPGRIGAVGYSQGGWVAPLAAARSTDLSFVVANYGMIDSPRDEMRLEVEAELRRLGHGPAEVAEVGRLADAAVDVMASGYRDWHRFDRLTDAYRDRPWIADLPYPLREFLRWPHFVVGLAARFLDIPGLPWDYTSIHALDELARRGIPSAWLIASHDRSAPNEFTLRELARRSAAGEPVQMTVLEPTDHGFRLFEEDDDGTRRFGNYHPDYFETEVAYVRRLASLTRPPDSTVPPSPPPDGPSSGRRTPAPGTT